MGSFSLFFIDAGYSNGCPFYNIYGTFIHHFLWLYRISYDQIKDKLFELEKKRNVEYNKLFNRLETLDEGIKKLEAMEPPQASELRSHIESLQIEERARREHMNKKFGKPPEWRQIS